MKGLFSGRQISSLSPSAKLTRSQTSAQALAAIMKKYGSIEQNAHYFHRGKGVWYRYSLTRDKQRTGQYAETKSQWAERPNKLDWPGIDDKGASGKKAVIKSAVVKKSSSTKLSVQPKRRFSIGKLKAAVGLKGRQSKSVPKISKSIKVKKLFKTTFNPVTGLYNERYEAAAVQAMNSGNLVKAKENFLKVAQHQLRDASASDVRITSAYNSLVQSHAKRMLALSRKEYKDKRYFGSKMAFVNYYQTLHGETDRSIIDKEWQKTVVGNAFVPENIKQAGIKGRKSKSLPKFSKKPEMKTVKITSKSSVKLTTNKAVLEGAARLGKNYSFMVERKNGNKEHGSAVTLKSLVQSVGNRGYYEENPIVRIGVFQKDGSLAYLKSFPEYKSPVVSNKPTEIYWMHGKKPTDEKTIAEKIKTRLLRNPTILKGRKSKSIPKIKKSLSLKNLKVQKPKSLNEINVRLDELKKKLNPAYRENRALNSIEQQWNKEANMLIKKRDAILKRKETQETKKLEEHQASINKTATSAGIAERVGLAAEKKRLGTLKHGLETKALFKATPSDKEFLQRNGVSFHACSTCNNISKTPLSKVLSSGKEICYKCLGEKKRKKVSAKTRMFKEGIALEEKFNNSLVDAGVKQLFTDKKERENLQSNQIKVREWALSSEAQKITPKASFLVYDFLTGRYENTLKDLTNGKITKQQVYKILGKINKFKALPKSTVTNYTKIIKTYVLEKSEAKKFSGSTALTKLKQGSLKRRTNKIRPDKGISFVYNGLPSYPQKATVTGKNIKVTCYDKDTAVHSYSLTIPEWEDAAKYKDSFFEDALVKKKLPDSIKQQYPTSIVYAQRMAIEQVYKEYLKELPKQVKGVMKKQGSYKYFNKDLKQGKFKDEFANLRTGVAEALKTEFPGVLFVLVAKGNYNNAVEVHWTGEPSEKVVRQLGLGLGTHTDIVNWGSAIRNVYYQHVSADKLRKLVYAAEHNKALKTRYRISYTRKVDKADWEVPKAAVKMPAKMPKSVPSAVPKKQLKGRKIKTLAQMHKSPVVKKDANKKPLYKGFLVLGNTYPVKNQLKGMGAKWNADEGGWVVPVKSAKQLKAFAKDKKFTIKALKTEENVFKHLTEAERLDIRKGKMERKAERYENKAGKLHLEAELREKRAKDVLDNIPFGQPILIGHYTENWDRRRREKAHNNLVKAYDANKAGNEAERKAKILNRVAGNLNTETDLIGRINKIEKEYNHAKNKVSKAEENLYWARKRNDEREISRYKEEMEWWRKQAENFKSDIQSLRERLPKEVFTKPTSGVNISMLSGIKLKPLVGATSVTKRYHNKNLKGGNFAIEVRKGNNGIELHGEHDVQGIIRSLSIGPLYSIGVKVITPSNYASMTLSKLAQIIKQDLS